MTRNYIKFKDEHVHSILTNEKHQTVRYGWQNYPNIGDLVDLRDADGDVFAEAEITNVHRETIQYFSEHTHSGHRDYSSPEEMVDHIDQYYSDNLEPDSIITVITFEVKNDGEM